MEVEMRSRQEVLASGQQQRMMRETTPPNFFNSSIEWRRVFPKPGEHSCLSSWPPVRAWWQRTSVGESNCG
jgi:hypothetical protein